MNRQQIKKWSLLRHLNFKGYKRTASGNPLNMVKVMSPSQLTIYGNAVQDGTPSPDAPVEVQLCGDKTGNLIDITQINGSQIEVTDNKIYLSGYACATNISPEYFLEMTGLSIGDTITATRKIQVVNGTGHSASGRAVFRNRVTTGTSFILTRNTPVTIPEDFNSRTYYGLYLYGANQADESGEQLAVMSDFAIYKGSYTADTLPAYEPYGYKVSGRAEGLNLFTAEGRTVSDVADSVPSSTRAFGDNVIVEAISSNGYINSYQTPDYQIYGNTIEVYPASGSGYGIGFDFNVTEGERYSLSFTVLIGKADFSMSYYDADGVYLTRAHLETNTVGVFSSTVPSGAKKMILTLTESYGQTARHIKVTDIMLLQGTYTAETMPPYEPYQPPQDFAVYLPEQIAKVGDVADEVVVDMESKTAELRKNVGSVVADGEENWFRGGNQYDTADYTNRYSNFYDIRGNSETPGYFSNRFERKLGGMWNNPNSEAFNINNNQLHLTISNTRLGITADDEASDRTTKFKAWLNDNNVTVYAPLATPVTTDITSLQQWDAMPNIEGTVSITFDSTIPISNAEAEYHSKEYDAT